MPLNIPLLCHWNGDGDIARAWLDYYSALGVSEFHIVLHGKRATNRRFIDLCPAYPVTVHATYDGPFIEREKRRRLSGILPAMIGRWIFVVDSDEFVELPCRSLTETIRALERGGARSLAAPLLQRMRADGSLESPQEIVDPFAEFPLCSEDLYQRMGALPGFAWTSKFPLIYCDASTELRSGNHRPATRPSADDTLRGVSHHFKWRRSVLNRLHRSLAARSPWAPAEAGQYLRYLEAHDFRLPLADAFPYSRKELVRRGLLMTPRPRRVDRPGRLSERAAGRTATL